MKMVLPLTAIALLTASCSTLPPEGALWQDEVRAQIIASDTGGQFAYETDWIKENHPERYTYTHSLTGRGAWIRAWWDTRITAWDVEDLDFDAGSNDHDTMILSRARLNIDSGAVVRGWDAHLELQDARDIADEDENRDELDIRRLYMHLGNAYTSYGVKIGRFFLNTGSGRIFGIDNEDNTSPAFDGFAVTISDMFHYRTPRYNTWRVDAWHLRPVIAEPLSFDSHHEPYQIFGAYMEHRRFWPVTVSGGVVGRNWTYDEPGELTSGRSWSLDFTARAHGHDLERGFDYDSEVSMQIGERGDEELFAWFFYGELGHTFMTPWRPRVGFRLTWGSGDNEPTDGESDTFRYNSGVVQNSEMGFTGLLGWANCVTTQFEVSMKPARHVNVTAAARLAFLDSKKAPWFDRHDTVILEDPTGLSGRDLGAEYDIWLDFAPEDFWRVRTGYGLFRPGNMPEALGRDDDAHVFFMELSALF